MISTGLKQIDEFLSGGIPSCVLVDIFGANGTGKTQLLLQLSINSIKNGGNVLYLDTTGGFRPERILEIQKNLKINCNVLDKITVSRVTNTSEQINSIQILETKLFSLIVIDNITDLFSYEYKKNESIFIKNSIFMKYMSNLSQIATSKKIPVVMSNMIRTINDTEIENMKNAIDPYTHIKIHLYKKSSKFAGKVYWALNSKQFSYHIHALGLTDFSEDF